MKKGVFIFTAFLFAILITACGENKNSTQYNPQDYEGTYYGKGNSIVYATFNAEDMTVYVCMRNKAMTTYGYKSNWKITKKGMIFNGENSDITIIREFDGNIKINNRNFGTLNKE